MRFFSYKAFMILYVFCSLFIIQFVGRPAYASTKTITVNFNETDIKYSKRKEYDIISLPKFGFIDDTSKVGEPMMPKITIWVLLPPGTAVTGISIVSTKEKQLAGQYNIYPIQYPVTTGGRPEGKFVEPKQRVYSSNENYPGKIAEFYHENYFRDYNIAEITIYPLQYKTSQQELILNTEIRIAIDYSPSSKYQSLSRLRQNEEQQNEIEEIVKKLIINPEDLSTSSNAPTVPIKSSTSIKGKIRVVARPLSISYTPSATDGQNVDYVIITNDSLVSAFQPLANWKTKKGVVTTIKTISWISQNYSGSDTPEKIRHFIQDAYSNWGTDYILLGGDVDIIPSRVISWSFNGAPIITDQYYSAIIGNNWNMNGNDFFLEEYANPADFNQNNNNDLLDAIWVGRAPVHNSADINLFINKFLRMKEIQWHRFPFHHQRISQIC